MSIEDRFKNACSEIKEFFQDAIKPLTDKNTSKITKVAYAIILIILSPLLLFLGLGVVLSAGLLLTGVLVALPLLILAIMVGSVLLLFNKRSDLLH